MKVLIIGSGNFTDKDVISKLLPKVDYIICVDGGAEHIKEAKLLPNILIGDLDSISSETLQYFNTNKVQLQKFPSQKDKTDMELAIDYALAKGATEIILTGATGTRLDHTFANIMLLYPLLQKGINARIVDKYNEIYMIDHQLNLINEQDDSFVSIIPLLKDTQGVTAQGFQYETVNALFQLASTFGISNKVTSNEGIIKIEDGICLVIKSRD